MTLTPLDIHNKEFRVKLRGYDQDEVNDFLDQIIKDYELNLKENEHLAEGLKQGEEKLKYFNDLKNSLNQSIIVAQEAADKVKANAQREAEIINHEAQKQAEDIVDQANDKARHIVDDASQKAKRLTVETDDLKKQARIFRQKLQVMMESQLEVVKSSEWDEILKQGDTSNYEAIQDAIRRNEDLDKQAAKEVKSVSNNVSSEDAETEDLSQKKAVVIFPEETDDSGQHFDEGPSVNENN
ncbi:DivIVA domain-containing protein [Liquorilactobacillus capillatus]|uniref:Cell division initiation protein n=1 Tax=Liquorilactobacillus capillatus DSM 19910 TaxID=1423731 RepID=A0A0R1MBH4_9LACO|nr:DivIVA domain-containing protein [Liquorilactobacillus capillatus]KRL01411.1 cell division initiation protein [Liquorilactobacillus capillatus DSM 19910]